MCFKEMVRNFSFDHHLPDGWMNRIWPPSCPESLDENTEGPMRNSWITNSCAVATHALNQEPGDVQGCPKGFRCSC